MADKKPKTVMLGSLPDEEIKRIMSWDDAQVAEYRAILRGEDPHVKLPPPKPAPRRKATA